MAGRVVREETLEWRDDSGESDEVVCIDDQSSGFRGRVIGVVSGGAIIWSDETVCMDQRTCRLIYRVVRGGLMIPDGVVEYNCFYEWEEILRQGWRW